MIRGNRAAAALLVAWVVALAATLGAVFIGEVMGQEPCRLCWWQRVAMFPLAPMLGIALLVDDRAAWRYALPLALAGGAVAAWHSGLYLGLIPEPIEPCSRTGPSCTSDAMTIAGVVPLPVLSLAAFSLVAAALVVVARSRSTEPTP